MKELADYRKLFEQAKSRGETEKRSAVENLLNRYVNDPKIRSQAEVFSRAGKTKKIHEIVELELAMKREMRIPALEGLSEIEKARGLLENIDEDLETSRFMGFSYMAAEVRYGRVTPEDLDRQFTI